MREKLRDLFHEMYVLNYSLDEKEIKKERKELYEEVIKNHGTWQKGLKAYGITKKRLKERDRFHLYWILKKRFEKYGEKALRPKNIDPLTKDRIVEVYKTMKNLNRILKSWDEEKVLYEIRMYLMTGGEMENLKYEHPKLYQYMLKHFDDADGFYEEYYSRFGFGEEKEEKEKEAKDENEQETSKLKDMLILLGEYTNEEVESMIEASSKTKDDVMLYLMEELLNAKRKGEYPTEEKLKKGNLVMYYALKAHFGTMKNGLYEITETFAPKG